jgi:uncharacterized membrane protein YraQ (UPF0718 family)
MEKRNLLRTVLTQPLQYLLVVLVAAGILLAIFGYQAVVQSPQLAGVMDRLSIFTTIFLGIFIEAAPFLLLGTLASGLVEVYVGPDELQRLAPRRPLAAALFGGVMGMFFPVCECGVVPLTRRLFRKGLPTAAGITFLLASPVVNPIVIASTAAAFGFGQVLFLRLGLSLLIAVFTGLVFARQKDPAQILRPAAQALVLAPTAEHPDLPATSHPQRLRRALLICVDEFFEMGRYLVIGALLAALLQSVITQSVLLQFGQGPVLSVVILMALAVILSICSTVDAFIALSFASTFSPGAVIAFLVFGPMVDIKSALMYFQVFRRRSAVLIILLPLVFSLLAGVVINLYLY